MPSTTFSDLVSPQMYKPSVPPTHTMNWPAPRWPVLDAAHQKRNLAEYEGFLEVEESAIDEPPSSHSTESKYSALSTVFTGVQYSVRDFVNAAAKDLDMQIRLEGSGVNEKGYWTNSSLRGAQATPAQRAQDAAMRRSRVEGGIGHGPTKQSSAIKQSGAADAAIQPSRHCEEQRDTSPEGAGRHSVAVPRSARDWPQVNKAIQKASGSPRANGARDDTGPSLRGGAADAAIQNNPIVAVDPRYFRPTEVETLLRDATKAKNKLGWTPKITFDELVAEMVREDFKSAERDELANTPAV